MKKIWLVFLLVITVSNLNANDLNLDNIGKYQISSTSSSIYILDTANGDLYQRFKFSKKNKSISKIIDSDLPDNKIGTYQFASLNESSNPSLLDIVVPEITRFMMNTSTGEIYEFKHAKRKKKAKWELEKFKSNDILNN